MACALSLALARKLAILYRQQEAISRSATHPSALIRWQSGGNFSWPDSLASRRVAGLEAMCAKARELAADRSVAEFHVFAPDGMIGPEALRRLCGVSGC